jgi:hypothetical protein
VANLAKPAVAAVPAVIVPPLKPRITCQPPFGADHMPAQYTQAWQAMLSQCPPSVKTIVWEAALFDAATLVGDWGNELVRQGWQPGDLFDVPHHDRQGGLVWFLRGRWVAALGQFRAVLDDGRVYDRAP